VVLINKFGWYYVRSSHTEVEDSAVLSFDSAFAASVVRLCALNGCCNIEDGRQPSSAAPLNMASFLRRHECSLYSGNTTEFRFRLLYYRVVRHGQFQLHTG